MNSTSLKSQAMKISVISIFVNLLLSIIKLLAGIIGHSQALIADALHSASDVLSTIIVIVSLLVSSKSADSNHEYGHQKYENLATLALAVILCNVGLKIGYNGATSIINKSYQSIQIPTLITAAAAAISILTKELMYQFTIRVAKAENNNALKADAWHHRSDALSSVGSLLGVLFSMFGFPVMDAVASLVICIFIFKTAIEIVIDAIKGLTDAACDKKTEDALKEMILSINGVLMLDSLKTRIFGSGYYVDVEIQADGALSLAEAHAIAEEVHDSIEANFPSVWHCMVHVNPSKSLTPQ